MPVLKKAVIDEQAKEQQLQVRLGSRSGDGTAQRIQGAVLQTPESDIDSLDLSSREVAFGAKLRTFVDLWFCFCSQDLIKDKDTSIRKFEQEVESLAFRNQQLASRVEVLQGELEHTQNKKHKVSTMKAVEVTQVNAMCGVT